jgi:hypothetical protein
MTNLLIATPIRAAQLEGAAVSYGYHRAMCALRNAMPVETIGPECAYATDAVRGRNRMAAIALQEYHDWTHILWWDDDEWPSDVSIVPLMIGTGAQLIGAPYTNKSQPLRWVHQLLDPCPKDDGCQLLVRSLGFGFTVATRECMQKMYDAARKYTDWPVRRKVANMFLPTYDDIGGGPDTEDQALLSEDFSFCKRWRDMGGVVTLYTGPGVVYHAGPHAYSCLEMPGGTK